MVKGANMSKCRTEPEVCKQQTDGHIEHFGKKIRYHNCCQDPFYLMCNVNKIEVDFQNYTGYCYVPHFNSWNFTDLTDSFERIDKEINLIVCFQEMEDGSKYDLDEIYLKKDGEWLWMPDYIKKYSLQDFKDRVRHMEGKVVHTTQ
jgi:hypothetical protein